MSTTKDVFYYKRKCAKLHARNKRLKQKNEDLEQDVEALIDHNASLKARLAVEALKRDYVILRLTDADHERAKASYLRHTVNGLYNREIVRDGRYPQIPFITDRGSERKAAGEVRNAQERFTASHVRLVVIDGQLPMKPGLHASHLCHELYCLNHLVWEPAAVNYSRHQCVIAQTCLGHGQYPDCVFQPHEAPQLRDIRKYRKWKQM